ncbi:MAG: hypothetical protein QNJ70_21385 [Xenococcaceae cyanobacterium MO_207.B15]|nr:hypothetical protein [Xenococcaceae cyanobacterium MO_207.B15]
MKSFTRLVTLALFLATVTTSKVALSEPVNSVNSVAATRDLELRQVKVSYLSNLDLLVFEQKVKGTIGKTLPNAAGQMDTAPVLGYVFPTTLKPEDVGFNSTEGIVALAVTSHPDFDDTPLWDEDNDNDYANDGVIFHTHWVVLTQDERVTGGLSVKEFKKEDNSVILPPTNPGMPMYMDSPGFSVVSQKNTLKVLVPAQRVNRNTEFNFDGVTAYMEVNTSDENRPLLGVYQVYSIRSGDLGLPYRVQQR